MNYEEIIYDLINRSDEEEWFDLKENWFEPIEIGEYISALSNAAAVCGKAFGYLLWGVNDETHKIVGCDINYNCSYKKEPWQNFLARNLNPSIAFEFKELSINNNRLVLLIIPAAVKVPTSFDKVRYGRIGSSKIKLEKYPEREAILWNVLFNGYPTMINTESPIQDLTFNQLKNYYLSKNMLFNDSNFINNMHLKTSNGKFNMLACFLADNGEIPVRVSIFSGVTKADRLFSVKEFGNQSLVSVIDRIIDYSDSINMTKSIEHFDKGYREDVPLFNQECFNEALKNAFIHNNWLRRVSPMVTFYNDRVEIISFSKLAPRQTIEGFYKGNSIPVNEDLSSIFLATHLSERTGKGMPLLVSTYGKNIFELSDESIKVTIPYNWQHKFEELVDNQVDKLVDKLSKTEKIVFDAIKDNPHLSQPELAKRCNVGKTTIQNVIIKLKELNLIDRVGSNKTGYWEIKE